LAVCRKPEEKIIKKGITLLSTKTRVTLLFIHQKPSVMKNYLIFAIILSVSYFPGFAQTSSQTRTATHLNNLNQFRDVFGDQGYPRATAGDVAADDNIYGCTRKLIAIRDSTSSFRYNSVSSLALQGFGFTIHAILSMVEPTGIMIKSNFIVFTNI
jgi:hypothetical protein